MPTCLSLTTESTLDGNSESLMQAFEISQSEVTKACKVKVAPVSTHRLGLVATESISKGEAALAMPYDDRFVLSAKVAKSVFQDVLPDSFDCWTGEAGLMAILLLNEVARLSEGSGLAAPKRPDKLQSLMTSWISALPTPEDMVHHPLFWSEEDQEILQFSSTRNFYKILDDVEEDIEWLISNVFGKDRKIFPEAVKLNGKVIPCFSVEGFKWALVLVQSRSFFLDGALRLIPFLDMCNHADDGEEIQAASMGPFGSIKGAKLIAQRNYSPGEEVLCSYGPKSGIDYLIEHGFCPGRCFVNAVAELTFEIDPNDRFRDDKLDILEFETYEQAPMDPVQSFDIVSIRGKESVPDPALLQFLRLCKLGGTDAFLLESIFRKDVWGFMAYPVSEINERAVIETVLNSCNKALDDFSKCPEGGPPVCAQIREAERLALTRCSDFFKRDSEALDLKEYYQERRLKDLGLDSEWSPEEEMMGDELSFGQTRTPGGADYDW